MGGQLVDTYGHADGSDADKWSAVSKWVVRTPDAVPGGVVFTSTEWMPSAIMVRALRCVPLHCVSCVVWYVVVLCV